MKKRSIFALIKGLLNLVGGFIGVILLAVINGTLGNILSISIISFAGLLILKFLGISISLSYPLLMTIIVLAGLLRGVLRYFEQYSNHYIAFKILAILRSKIFRHLRALSPAKLEAKNKGDIISLLEGDIETLEVFYAHTISPFLIAIFTSLTVILFVGFTTNWYFSLFAFVAYLIIGVLIPVIYYNVNKKDGRNYRKKLGAFEDFYLDSIYGGYEIIALNNEKERMEALNSKSKELVKLNKKISSKGNNFGSLTNITIIILNLLFILIGGILIQNNILDEGVRLILAFVTFTSSFGSVIALSNLPGNLTMTFASGNRVLDLLEEKPLVEEPKVSHEFDFEKVEVKNLSFNYTDSDEAVLNNINFHVNKNEIVGILGKSGSGKSTLLKLLMKFYLPNEGTIEYNGINIKDINTNDLYENVNLFSQNTFLFTGTIYDNLIMAKPTATKDEIIKACKDASIYNFIMSLNDGFDTKISDLKDNISSGEKQRLGLARVFLREPKLLLLDEATANIDALNEGVILNALSKHSSNMAIVIISHRKSTLNICDRLYKMEDGTLVNY